MNNKLIFRKIKKIKVKKFEKGQTEPLIQKSGGAACHGIAAKKRGPNVNENANTLIK